MSDRTHWYQLGLAIRSSGRTVVDCLLMIDVNNVARRVKRELRANRDASPDMRPAFDLALKS